MEKEQLRDNISKGCQRHLKKAKEEEWFVGRFAPYGFIKENHKLILDKKCSHIVYLIFDLYDKGDSCTKIAKYLNDRGIVCPSYYRKSGIYMDIKDNDVTKKWQRGTVRNIIKNTTYNGYNKLTGNKTLIELVDTDLFNRANLRLNRIKNEPVKELYYFNGNELHGKVICGCCGLHFNNMNNRCKDGIEQYLRCGSVDLRGKYKIKCDNTSIRYEEIYEIVSMFLKKEILSKIILDRNLFESYHELIKGNDIINNRFYLKQEKKVIENELNRLEKNINDGLYNIRKLKDEKKLKIERNLKNRYEELNNIQKNLISFGRSFELSNKDLIVDKFLIDEFVEKIIVNKIENNNRDIRIVLK